MTRRAPSAALRSIASGVRLVGSSPLAAWCAFIVVHLVVGLLNLYGEGYPLGDVTSVYPFWVDQALVADYWVGVDGPWVYPIVAIVPMLAAHLTAPIAASIPALAPLSIGSGLYAGSWLGMILLLDLAAFGALTEWGRRRDRLAAAWWWTAFVLALGPIALGRIDSVTVPIAVVGALFIITRPVLAAVLLTIAAWIKVWPGALVMAMVVACRDRTRIALWAGATSIGIVALALSYGSGANVFSFVTQQTDRGLQVEAPISTIWMWRAAAGDGTLVYYDQDVLTWQVSGAGAAAASGWMTPLMLLVVTMVVLLGVVAVRRGASGLALLPPLSLAILSAMIALQKVGSPQFMTWLCVPVILGLVLHRQRLAPSFAVGAVLVILLAVLTQAIYPVNYGRVLGLDPIALTILTARNLLVFVVLGWAVMSTISVARWRATDVAVATDADDSALGHPTPTALESARPASESLLGRAP
ncbi:MAG: hypothetical protein RI885_2463 [Actinomycetota bacterium]